MEKHGISLLTYSKTKERNNSKSHNATMGDQNGCAKRSL